MVLINNKKFTTYELDTEETILDRISFEMDTLPKYLYFPDDNFKMETLKSSDNIKVLNLFKIITEEQTGFDFKKMYESIKKYSLKLNFEEDILIPFLIFNKNKKGEMSGNWSMFIQGQIENLNREILKIKDDKIYDIVDNILKQQKDYLKKYEEKKDKLYKNVKEKIEIFQDYEKGVNNFIKFTEFELENVSFEVILNVENLSILEIFNQIKLNPFVPFVSINDYYKILKDFTPSEDWSNSLTDILIFKVLQKRVSTDDFEDYTNAFMLFEEDENGEKKLHLKVKCKISSNFLKKEEIIERIFSVFENTKIYNINNKKIIENDVNGVFYFPKHELNNHVFSDLVLNNKLFSMMMAIDESSKATKTKSSLYIHFNNFKIGNLTANITRKISSKLDSNLKGKDFKDLFKIGSTYIRVKISSCKNIESVLEFQKIISKLLYIYDLKYNEIEEFYKKFIPKFGHIEVEKIIKPNKLTLKDAAPEVFMSGYARKCPNSPIIIDDDEVEDYIKQGKSVMRYPKSNNEGFIPRNYVCDRKGNIYPGLRNNDLPNKDLIPYLPCCYSTNPDETAGSYYRHYFYGEEPKVSNVTKQQDLINTNKFLGRNQFGNLPLDLLKVFQSIDLDLNYKYVRKGVFDTKNTFIECVLEGVEDEDLMNKDEEDKKLEESLKNKNRIKFISNFRKSLIKYESASKQSTFDFTKKEIIDLIENESMYFDPRLFLQLFESIYNCNIYVFTRKENTVELTLPRFSQSLKRFERFGKTIFIYEHMGSTSDNSKYPRCELITKWKENVKSDVNYNFSKNSKISIEINLMFEKMIESFSNNIKNIKQIFPIKSEKIIRQGIDSYGKCRMVEISHDGKVFSVLTEPMQPLLIGSEETWKIKKRSLKDALDLCKELDIKIDSQSVYNKNIKSINGTFGNVKISIPIKDSNLLKEFKIIKENFNYSVDENSDLVEFSKIKKIARYITEYFFWTFSIFINKNNINILEEDVLNTIIKFNNEKVKVDKNYKYDFNKIPKEFSLDCNVFKNSKFIINSEELLKRLIYALRMLSLRNRKVLMSYKDKKYIENFYLDITDFEHINTQVILKGKDSISKWIYEKTIKYSLNKKILLDMYEPYFFRNENVGSNIYLAQNVDSLEKAMTISKTWVNEKYNIGEDCKDESILSFKLFSYENENTITKYKVLAENSPYEISIIGCKNNDQELFTVLLSI